MTIELKECTGGCGWVFVGWTRNAKLCNGCGNNEQHPRICKVGAKETDARALLSLALYTLQWWGGERLQSNLRELVSLDIGDALAKQQD